MKAKQALRIFSKKECKTCFLQIHDFFFNTYYKSSVKSLICSSQQQQQKKQRTLHADCDFLSFNEKLIVVNKHCDVLAVDFQYICIFVCFCQLSR